MDNHDIKLWQLINPTLPIGAFAYSQSLEYAIDAGWINDEASAEKWTSGLLQEMLSVTEVPVFLRCYKAVKENNWQCFNYCNQLILAMRESSELYEEDVHIGAAMLRVLPCLDIQVNENINTKSVSYVAVFSYACAVWDIEMKQAAQGFLWAWCENQVAAAIKLVPLGQSSGQRILSSLRESIVAGVEQGMSCSDEDIGMLAPGFAMASAQHELQYSRLFRS